MNIVGRGRVTHQAFQRFLVDFLKFLGLDRSIGEGDQHPRRDYRRHQRRQGVGFDVDVAEVAHKTVDE